MELLVEEDFYRTAHKKVYQAMLELSDTGEVTVSSYRRVDTPEKRWRQ